MIRGIIFASCYVYSPSGSGAASERSRLLRALLKASDAHFIFKYAVRVRQQVADNSALAGFLCPNNVLIPIPGSAPPVAGAVSVAEHLALALIEEGLGQSIWRGLHRIYAVRKSATAAPGSRPTVGNHYDSFAIEPVTGLPQQVVLIDDVVTKGRTLLAAAARVQEAFPSAEIRAFALLRTMGLVPGVDQLLDPCVGEIRWRDGDAYRTP
jgi:pyrimidine operon attenuation protein/uracil phosphoribosyltransferase